MVTLKNALITGASRGIGAETARALRRLGYDLYLNYVSSEERATALAEELDAVCVRADVGSEEEVSRMFRELPGIDILVNNAGISHYGLLSDTDASTWNRLMDVNAGGTYRCIRNAIPHMIRHRSGVIINVSSVWGMYGASCEAAYSASKSALHGLTLSLAKELGPSGIRVNCVCPGVIATDMLSGFSDDERRELSERTPLGRLGTARDVAELIAFLSSDRASFITGQIIGVTGGFGL